MASPLLNFPDPGDDKKFNRGYASLSNINPPLLWRRGG
jgi:hypothetical protein